MADPASVPPKKPSKSALSFFIWWKPDPQEVQKQVDQYHTLKVWQSARGMSMLCCAFSVAATVLLGRLIQVSSTTTVIEAAIWSGLGFSMYRGQRWAFLVGMVLWTFEKFALLFQTAAAGRAPITQVIWWLIYMSVFNLGFVVERRRRSLLSTT
jgi:4-hydroxybenzoate polyprenyltransferase